MIKVNYKGIRTTPSGAFIVNFEHNFTPCSRVSIATFEHVIAGWESALSKST